MRITTTIPVNGAALREIRVRTGVGRIALADEVGIDKTYVTKIERGLRRVSPELYAGLNQALHISDQRVLRADLVEAS